MAVAPAPEGILTVAALTRMIRDTLAEQFPAVWVKGEVSGFKRSDRGHLYFSLKEGKDAVLECVMWSTAASRLGFELRDGAQVDAFGSITVYPPRGRYQLVTEELRPSGIGALLLALEELKRRLQAEGLFDAARKRPLPRFPRRVGLVTSPAGAAVRDMVTVARKRWPAIELVLAPVRVQGEGAAEEIAAAIERFNRYGRVDLLIVGRGGGSLEDLWAFNEERVVRAIAASRLPTIAAVGHEVDWTLADLAADVRAATPSNAAEIAVPDWHQIAHRIGMLDAQLERAIRRGLEERRRHLERLLEKYAFRRQREALGLWIQRIDELVARLVARTRATLAQARARLEAARRSYGLREWARTLVTRRAEVAAMHGRLHASLVGMQHAHRQRLTAFEDRLRALAPQRVLERGYCLARGPDGRLVRAAVELRVGDPLTVEFARGEVDTRVEAVRDEEPDAP